MVVYYAENNKISAIFLFEEIQEKHYPFSVLASIVSRGFVFIYLFFVIINICGRLLCRKEQLLVTPFILLVGICFIYRGSAICIGNSRPT
jgi:hypothetical protein